jgi:hypothetical protein
LEATPINLSPDQTRAPLPDPTHATLIIACGALAHDLLAMRARRGWLVDIVCAPAILHNTPGRIAPAVERKIQAAQGRYARVIVAYGDCGTSGALDSVLDRLGIMRVRGPHCYEQFGGVANHDTIMDEAPGTYFLTDFLTRHFESLVWRGLGLDRHPELRDSYFGNYTQAVYLAQSHDAALQGRAEQAAARIGLPLQIRYTGGGELERRLEALISNVGEPRYNKQTIRYP